MPAARVLSVCLLLLAAAVAVVVCATSGRSAPLTFGVTSSASDAAAAQRLRLLGDGVAVVRSDASWNALEPRPGQFDFSATDRLVSVLAAAGKRWYPMLGYTTPWAARLPGNLFSGPRDPADYGRYVTQVARRYGRAGSFWAEHPELPRRPVTDYEIWNEPNNPTFLTSASPREYAQLYSAAAPAILAVDPQARVVFGAALQSAVDGVAFIDDALMHVTPGLRRTIRTVAWHPYLASGPGTYEHLARLHRVWNRWLTGPPDIQISEIGSNLAFTAPGQWARMFSVIADRLARSDSGVSLIVGYHWGLADTGPDAVANGDGWLMMLDGSGRVTAYGQAMIDAAQRLRTRLRPRSTVLTARPVIRRGAVQLRSSVRGTFAGRARLTVQIRRHGRWAVLRQQSLPVAASVTVTRRQTWRTRPCAGACRAQMLTLAADGTVSGRGRWVALPRRR